MQTQTSFQTSGTTYTAYHPQRLKSFTILHLKCKVDGDLSLSYYTHSRSQTVTAEALFNNHLLILTYLKIKLRVTSICSYILIKCCISTKFKPVRAVALGLLKLQ
jgi:hypothetical protein